jgi:hypothetical protein
MFAITSRYALAEEATLDTREQKKEKDLGHADQPISSKGHDKKRKTDRFDNAVERPKLGNLMASWIAFASSTHRESTRLGTVTDQEKKPKEPKGDFLEAHKEVNYIYGGPDSYESRQKQKLIAR